MILKEESNDVFTFAIDENVLVFTEFWDSNRIEGRGTLWIFKFLVIGDLTVGVVLYPGIDGPQTPAHMIISSRHDRFQLVALTSDVPVANRVFFPHLDNVCTLSRPVRSKLCRCIKRSWPSDFRARGLRLIGISGFG